ncbi:protein kinase domain-containing protein [Paenibacillus lautus]|uniref:protein kinase domain-containing protein n=1 Tax=Paenibacillus lautus TaxID=1401 RepID=UPI003D9AAC29
MAQVAGGGIPTTDGEKRLVRTLREGLPDSYLIYHNFELPSDRGQHFEYDVVVVGTHAIYVIEDKYWHGTIKGNDIHCILNSGTSKDNPAAQSSRLAKILRSYLLSKAPVLAKVWVQDVIHISGNNVSIEVQGNTRQKMTTPETICHFILNRENLTNSFKQRTEPIGTYVPSIQNALKPVSFFENKRRIHEYQIVETGEQTELYKEYTGYNVNLGESSQRLLIKEFFMDPYLSYQDQQRQMRLLKRDYKALEALRGSRQIIRPRTGFEPDGDAHRFVVVYDQAEGKPLTEWFLEEKRMPEKQIRKLLLSALRALKDVHDNGLVHRNLSPDSLLIDEGENVVYLRNFEYSRLPKSMDETIGAVGIAGVVSRYKHLEALDLSHADKSHDLYSLGTIFYDLLAGTDTKQLIREGGRLTPPEQVEDSELAEIILGLSDSRSDARYPDVDTVIELIADAEKTADSGFEVKDRYQVGDRIDNRYYVEEIIGSGGSSEVYRAFYEPSEEMFAIKIMKNQRGSIETVKAEYRKLRELRHDHIAKVKDVDTVGGGRQYLLKMEYIKGKPLSRYLSDKEFTVHKMISWGKQILSAICYLQVQHPPIVHADIKPANIMINDEGNAVLIDFNVSRHAGDSHVMGGTRRYMAPDALTSPNDLSNDTFSLGVVLFEAICDKYPFESTTPQVGGAVRDPRQSRSSLSLELADWLVKACQPAREDRFPSAAAMLEALNSVPHLVEAQYSRAEELEAELNRLPLMQIEGKRYFNRFLPYYQSFYSQSAIGNAGTRGLDVFSRLTYVDTKLDRQLRNAILSARHKLVIITGNAGDGKTAFIKQLERLVEQKQGSITYYDSKNGSEFEFEGVKVITNYDGSQDEGDQDNTDVLDRFFEPFKGLSCFDNAQSDEVRMIAINEGRLLEFLSEHPDYPDLKEKVIAYLNEHKADDSRLVIINLNWRSVVARSSTATHDSIAENLLERFTDPAFFRECRDCTHKDICPVYYNVNAVRDESIGSKVREQIRGAVNLVHMRKKLHITMRDIRSALSYILFGTLSCGEIAELSQSEHKSAYQLELLACYYYNRLFNWHPAQSSSDRVMQQLEKIDAAEVPVPSTDRQLSLIAASGQSLYQQADLASKHDLALLDRLFDSRPKDYRDFQEAGKVEAFRHFLKMSKRKYYCEGLHAASEGEKLLPYNHAEVFAELVSGAKDPTIIKPDLIRAISYTEQVYHAYADGNICIREIKQKGSSIVSVRVFPERLFAVRVQRPPGGDSGYVEHIPDSIELYYMTNPRIKFTITLDLYELLMKVLQGYVPSRQELRGPFINLTIFKNQISGLHYDTLILTEDERQFYQLQKKDGKLTFAPALVQIESATRTEVNENGLEDLA